MFHIVPFVEPLHPLEICPLFAVLPERGGFTLEGRAFRRRWMVSITRRR